MGKKSVKEDKTVYQLRREELELTRAQASELLGFISESRLEKIENRRSPIYPEEVLTMAKSYKSPTLCNYYCSHECPIGIEYIPEIEVKELSQIVIEMLASLNALNKEKDRLIDISSDGIIDDVELQDFIAIQENLERISLVADTLKLWVEKTIDSGQINKEKIQALRENTNK